MRSSQTPGYKPPGHPAKVNRREERRRAREERRERDTEYMEAVRRHESRHPVVRARDEMVTADEVVHDPGSWDPDRNDLAHVDTGPDYDHGGRGRDIWERTEKVGSIAPVQGRPTMDPAPPMHQVAMMTGWLPGHNDPLEGIDKMVTGEVDARQELRVESNTPGSPLQLGMTESVYSDDTCEGSHGCSLSAEEKGDRTDWCAWL